MNERNVHENVVACGRYGLKRAIGGVGGHSSSDTLTGLLDPRHFCC
jgi:hypothetical protein